MTILVIQISTNDMRGVLFNENSDILFQTESSYQPQYMGNGIVEQSPAEWVSALTMICRSCMEYLAAAGAQVDAVAYTSVRSSIIPVDNKGQALRNAIMWEDTRNASYVHSLAPHAERLYELSGSVPNTVFSGTKMRWIMDHEPEIYEKTYKFCSIADYLNYKMTGEFKTDYTYANRSLLMNIDQFTWDQELLSMIGIEAEKLCEILPPGSIVGFLTKEFSLLSGLPEGIPVISSGGAQQCIALGGGVLEEHATEISVGPGGYIFTCSDKRAERLSDGIMCSAHAIPGKYMLECTMLNSDDLYRWVNHLLYDRNGKVPKSFTRIDEAVDNTPVGSNGCIAIPYLSGRGTPDWNMAAFGGFLNMTPATTRGDMARSVLEAIACEMRTMLDVLEGVEELPREIFLGGYLVHSKAFCQMLADATGIVMKRNITPIAQTAFGAFVVASVTLGIYGTYEEAFFRGRQHNRYKTYIPNENNHEIYSKLRDRICDLYLRLVR